MDPTAAVFARSATARMAHSALPDAPVVPESPAAAGARRCPGPVRRATAVVLRRLADRLYPEAALN